MKYNVNIDIANETKQDIASILNTSNTCVLNKVGAFASLYDLEAKNYKHPILVLKTEEPGSKQVLAAKYNMLDSIAQDMINHLINDCIVMGAKPLAVQDAIICGKINHNDISKLVKAMSDACRVQGCILTGGETSEQPEIIPEGIYILTSSIIGIVEKENIIDGSKIEEGDIILGLPSNGPHTNGYTLIRQLLKQYPKLKEDTQFITDIMRPHKCYYNEIKHLFKTDIIHGMAHITGGGICENLNRILPQNLSAQIDASTYKIPSIFNQIKELGNVDEREMLRTFNLGIGLTLVVKPNYPFIPNAYPIGIITKGNQTVNIVGQFEWS